MPFDPEKFIEKSVPAIAKQVGKKHAIIAVSGGVDSAVAALLAARAVGANLTAVFVDTGLMRKNEAQNVKKAMESAGIRLKVVDARNEFFSALAGISEPEQKRKIIGGQFITVFEKVALECKSKFLVQGTIAPDWIESGGAGREKIKSHHNVGGLPEKMRLELCEPLRDCYKHEVRMLARELGLPPEVSERQPFPGPALAVRIVGEVTPEKAGIVREACAIVEEEIEKSAAAGEIERPWQYFAALLDSRTVGVRGDERSYKYAVAVRAVRSLDGMTASYSQLPHALLTRISTRITNEIREVGRVLYDITNKPPATVEME